MSNGCYSIGNRFICFAISKTAGWFKVSRYGVMWKDLTVHALTFSQREGLERHFEIGKWSISFIHDKSDWRR